MNNINENSTVETITAAGVATECVYGKLPEIAYFRVQSRNMVGSIKKRHERKCGAWALLVSCKDGKGLRLVSDVGYEHGMVIRAEFKTREDAIEAGKKYLSKWGKKSEPKAKKSGAKKTDDQKLADLIAKMDPAAVAAAIEAAKQAKLAAAAA